MIARRLCNMLACQLRIATPVESPSMVEITMPPGYSPLPSCLAKAENDKCRYGSGLTLTYELKDACKLATPLCALRCLSVFLNSCKSLFVPSACAMCICAQVACVARGGSWRRQRRSTSEESEPSHGRPWPGQLAFRLRHVLM